ncbi:hypothetical protein [Caldanaerovirga acetigignens]|uniref:hypothetical protein n=1 Tax=Caldanaerovirga acetigignens TaxID=447595 RepID=UPI000932C5E5|nr:hypothetical protein [Caldanaerovirga acetigignens]
MAGKRGNSPFPVCALGPGPEGRKTPGSSPAARGPNRGDVGLPMMGYRAGQTVMEVAVGSNDTSFVGVCTMSA